MFYNVELSIYNLLSSFWVSVSCEHFSVGGGCVSTGFVGSIIKNIYNTYSREVLVFHNWVCGVDMCWLKWLLWTNLKFSQSWLLWEEAYWVIKSPNWSISFLLLNFHEKINQMLQMIASDNLLTVYCRSVFSSLWALKFVWLLLWRNLEKQPPFLPINTLKTWRSPYFHCLPFLQEDSSHGAFGPSVDTFMVCHEISRQSQRYLWTSVAASRHRSADTWEGQHPTLQEPTFALH